MSLDNTREIKTAKIIMVKGEDGQGSYTAGSGLILNGNQFRNAFRNGRCGKIDSIGSGYAHTEIDMQTSESVGSGSVVILKSEVSGTAHTLRIQRSSTASDVSDRPFYTWDGTQTSVDIKAGDLLIVTFDMTTGYRAQVLDIIGENSGLAGLGIGNMTSYASNVIDTNIDLQRDPVVNDRLLLYCTSNISVSGTIGIKTYNNGTAVTTNIGPILPQTLVKGLNILQCVAGIPSGIEWNVKYNIPIVNYSAGTGIMIDNNGVISNANPNYGNNYYYKKIDSAIDDGDLGEYNGYCDNLIIDFHANAVSGGDAYTLTLLTGTTSITRKYAVLKDRSGNPFTRDINAGMILKCESNVSGSGTEIDPVVVTVLEIANWYVESGRKANTTIGARSTAEGEYNTVSGTYGHADGFGNTASGNSASAHGIGSTASGDCSVADGSYTTASGANSSAHGDSTTASGAAAFSGGEGTVAGYANQTALGQYNKNKSGNLLEVGNGSDDDDRSNAMEVTADGNIIDGNGYSTTNGVRSAFNLLSKSEVAESVPYLYRRSGGVVRDVALEHLKKVIGASVAWNQLVPELSATYFNFFRSTGTFSNGVATFTCDNTNGSLYQTGVQRIAVVSNHKFLVTGDIKTTSATTSIRLKFGTDRSQYGDKNVVSSTNWQNVSFIALASETVTNSYVSVIDGRTSNWDEIQVKNLMCINLTQMFGTAIADYIYNLEQATAGSGIAKLKEWGFFTKAYYAYNTGTLQSVKTSGKKCVGKNLLKRIGNTVTINGVTLTFNDDGTITANGTSTNYVWLTTAYIGGQSYNLDKSKNYILSGCPSGFGNNGGLQLRDLSSGQNNALYIGTGSGKQFINDNGSGFTIDADNIYDDSGKAIDINASTTVIGLRINPNVTVNNLVFRPMLRFADADDGYEPYTEKTYPLSNVDLRGLFKLDSNNNLYADGDEYTPDGNVKRKMLEPINLGNLVWSIYNAESHIFRAEVSGRAYSSVRTNLIVSKNYVAEQVSSVSSLSDKCITGSNNDNNIYIRDTAYSDADVFKTAMNGVYLIAEKATPTTETTTPYNEVMLVDGDGTEEFLDSRDIPVPVGHESEYNQSFKGLPTAPTTDGNYKLRCTVANGQPSFSWVSDT